MTGAALQEIFKMQREMDGLLAQPHVSKEQRKRADILMSKIASIRDMGMSTDEAHRALAVEYGREIVPEFTAGKSQRAHEDLFKDYLRGAADNDIETRATTLVAGSQSIIYSAGQNGGFLVPTKFYASAAEGLALTDPLLDPSIVTLIQEPDFSLRPITIPGWDLSGVAAVKVGETSTYTSSNVPSITSEMKNGYTYRVAFDASLEWSADAEVYGDPMAALGRACGIAMARGVGQDLVTGNGVSAPQGVLTGSADSGVVTANAGKLVLEDFTNVFFSVNKIYRDSPKAAWLVSDAVAKMISNAVDGNQRPLFPVEDGITRICGKVVYVCPSLPAYNASLGTQAPGSFCVFGDLSHYYVHASNIRMQRLLQTPGLIEYGKCRYIALQRVDAVLEDPTDGALPPIVSARLHV
jgi:HK97 family phage major capsid protein